MKRVAVITARGGSKRIPRKNIRLFHGRPIIHYAIDAARASGLFDAVMVSTEDDEISHIAHLGGADETIQRPPELADDHATTAQVMKHAVDTLQATGERDLELVACIYPCTPLMLATDLQAGVRALEHGKKLYALSVAEYAPSIHRALIRWPDGSLRAVWPNLMQQRTQDVTALERRYYDAGQWYIGRPSAWLGEVPIHDSWSVGIEIPRARAVDIDTEDDWLMALALHQSLFNQEGRGA